MAETTTENNTTATGGYLVPKGWEPATSSIAVDAYTKDETDALLAKKADNADLANYATIPELGTKAEKSDVYTKAQADELHKTLTKDLYSKSETVALLTAKVDKSTLEANYTNNTDLNKALNNKVSSADLQTAITQRQEEQEQLKASVLETASNLQSQIATMQGKLTDASTTMETSLTQMQSSLTTTASSINARYDELLGNISSVQQQLNAKDASLQTQITELDDVIPSAATSTNQLADKAYVEDLVKKGTARAISADANGAGFASYTALTTGPWFSLGESATPEVNDYAVVKSDATHNNNDVRYNFDGAVWVFFQEFSSGGGTLELTTAQTNALNSGATAALIEQITTNKNALANETTARQSGDTTLTARIATEESTRETAVNNLTAAIAAEKLARENASNQNLAKIETEAAARQTGDNEVKALVSTNRNEVDATIGSLAALGTHTKTSIVAALNDLHTEMHDGRLATDGSNAMTAQLDIVLAGSGDLLLMKAGDKGVNFHLDATTGYMAIVPESAKTTGFEVSYNTLKPRTSAVEYSLGDNSNYFTNAYITNLNGTAVSDFFTADNHYTNTQLDTKFQNILDRLVVLENAPDPSAVYFYLPSQQLILSSASDKYAENFETNCDLSDLVVTYNTEQGMSTISFVSKTQLKIHYVSGSSQNAKFTITYKPTGAVIGTGYLCTSTNGGEYTRIMWAGVTA